MAELGRCREVPEVGVMRGQRLGLAGRGYFGTVPELTSWSRPCLKPTKGVDRRYLGLGLPLAPQKKTRLVGIARLTTTPSYDWDAEMHDKLMKTRLLNDFQSFVTMSER